MFSSVVSFLIFICFVAFRRSAILLFFLFFDGLVVLNVDDMMINSICIEIERMNRFVVCLLLAITGNKAIWFVIKKVKMKPLF